MNSQTAHFGVSTVIINFTEHPQSQEVRFNDSVTLQCAVSNGVVTQWLFNNGPLLPSVGITVNGGTLVIASFHREMAGIYRCVAESATGSFTQVSHYARISYFSKSIIILQFFYYPMLHICDMDLKPIRICRR